MNQIKYYLQQLGLTEIEATLYQGLLETGPTTVKELADHVEIKRITTHFNIENLIEKGLVTQTMQGARRRIIAEPPERLRTIIEEKRRDLSIMETKLPQIIEQIHIKTPNLLTKNNPAIRYFEGEKGFKEVCQRSLDYARKEILFFSNLDEWYKVYTAEYDKEHYIPTRLKNNIFLKILVFNSQRTALMKEEDARVFRQTKFIKDKYLFKTTIIIYQDEVSMMLSSKPYTAILIQDREFYLTFKNIFNQIWDLID